MEQELSEVLPNFDLLTLAVVGEGIGDYRRLVFIDDIFLGVGRGEDDGSAHGYVGYVDSVESCIHDDLVGDIVLFAVGGSFSRGCSQQIAPDFALGFGVHGRNKLGCGGLPSLGFLLQVLPSFNIGGVCSMFGWWVWLGSGCFDGVGVCTGAGAIIGRWVVGVVFVLSGSLRLSLSLYLWVGANVAWAPGRLSGGGRALYSREDLLLHLGDSGAQRDDLLGQATCGDLKGGVVFGEVLGDRSANGSGKLV